LGLSTLLACAPVSEIVVVRDGRFYADGRPQPFTGVNFWAAMNLAVDDERGDRTRLVAELDHLKSLGVTNLRVMAASEGPATEPYRIVPPMQKSPGDYDDALWDAMDFVVHESGKRGMRLVMVLTNFWEWSGGMAQYVAWAEGTEIPYPATHDWTDFTAHAKRFYDCARCQKWYRAHVRAVVERENMLSGLPYRDDPAVFAWELANEPRYYRPEWVDDTAAYIKSLDSRHMVTTGSEGRIGGPFLSTHDGEHIDYATIHIWPENWDWFDPKRPETYDEAEAKAVAYIEEHVVLSGQLGKPLVIEEFGLARDFASLEDPYDPRSSTKLRDRFFAAVFEQVEAGVEAGNALVGDNLWAWSGQGRPGDSWVGDPPHEKPGWYSVYDADRSTLDLVAGHARRLSDLRANE
jgi:mannan endo-1,4-beta-mannosidase